MKSAISKNNAITLIEMLIVTALIGIVATMAFRILGLNWSTYSRQLIAAELQSGARSAMDKIARDFREAADTTVSGHTLTLTSPIGSTIVYQIADDKLQRNSGTLCADVDMTSSGFSWSPTGSRSVDVKLHLSRRRDVFTAFYGDEDVNVALETTLQRRKP